MLDTSWTDNKVRLTVDGASVDEMAAPNCGTATTFELRVGLGTATNEAATATYDNVIFELDPP